MSILKEINDIPKLIFYDSPFIKAFADAIKPPKNYQKEIAENLAKMKKEMQEDRMK